MKAEFGTHYSDLAKFHQAETEKQAALAGRKLEDIKIEVKLPETVKVPEGFAIKVDENDPRVPVIRDMAIKNGWPQETVDALVALDATQKIEAHNAEIARIGEEDKKLGANAADRKTAVATWLKGLKDNQTLTADEYEGMRVYATDAATVTALEKIIAKANGNLPANIGNAPPSTAPKSTAERMYPHLPSGLPPASARSA